MVGEIEPTGDALSLAGDGLTMIAYTAAADDGRAPRAVLAIILVSYVDTSEVRPGRLAELKAPITDLARLV